MSVRIMSRVWDSGPADPMQRLVLLAIADHADDQGRAYPSMIGIATKCGMTERGARGIIRKLEAGGFLDTQVGGGRGGKSHYTVNPEGQTRNDIPGMSKPGTTRPETRNDTTGNPEPRSAEPSITIKEPSEDIDARKPSKRKSQIPEDAVLSEKMESIARNEGISQQEAEAQFDRFKGYCIANAKTYASWDAAWRNWLRSPFFKPITTGGHNGNRPNSLSPRQNTGGNKQQSSLASIVAKRRHQQRQEIDG